jgi:hypothetical protein
MELRELALAKQWSTPNVPSRAPCPRGNPCHGTTDPAAPPASERSVYSHATPSRSLPHRPARPLFGAPRRRRVGDTDRSGPLPGGTHTLDPTTARSRSPLLFVVAVSPLTHTIPFWLSSSVTPPSSPPASHYLFIPPRRCAAPVASPSCRRRPTAIFFYPAPSRR